MKGPCAVQELTCSRLACQMKSALSQSLVHKTHAQAQTNKQMAAFPIKQTWANLPSLTMQQSYGTLPNGAIVQTVLSRGNLNNYSRQGWTCVCVNFIATTSSDRKHPCNPILNKTQVMSESFPLHQELVSIWLCLYFMVFCSGNNSYCNYTHSCSFIWPVNGPE